MDNVIVWLLAEYGWFTIPFFLGIVIVTFLLIKFKLIKSIK